MKTLIVLLALATASISLNAQKSQPTYVITKSDTIYFKKMNAGAFNVKGVTVAGEKVIIPNQEVLAYQNYGKRMDKLPLYFNNEKTGKTVMMELVYNKSKMRVFKYEYFNGAKDCMEVVLSFYNGNQCVITQTNPNFEQIKKTIRQIIAPAEPLLTEG